jgi:hypothetical protein
MGHLNYQVLMSKRQHWQIAFWGAVIGLSVIFGLGAGEGETPGETLEIKSQLVWGTDTEGVDDPNLKPLQKELSEKLRGIFKWHNYFEVKHELFKIPQDETKKIRISKQCIIEVTNFGKHQVEVDLYGEGQLVVKKRQKLLDDEYLVVAGDDKNNTAWFVVISLVKPEEQIASKP